MKAEDCVFGDVIEYGDTQMMVVCPGGIANPNDFSRVHTFHLESKIAEPGTHDSIAGVTTVKLIS